MTEQETRLECFRLASDLATRGDVTVRLSQILEIAKAIATFVIEGKTLTEPERTAP